MPPDNAGSGDASRRRRRGQSKGDLKEAAILATAWRLLAEKPMTSITVDELAAGAEISRSSFYFYFDSRDAVIRALASRSSRELGDVFRDLVKSPEPTHEDVSSMIRGLLARWHASGPIIRAMDALAEHDLQLRAFWAGVSQEFVTESAAAIDRLRAAGHAPPGPPSALDLAWALTHMYWRAGQQSSLNPASAADDERLVETLTVITMRAIYGRP